MIVGLGGNNGTTLTGMILANKHNLTWTTKRGVQKPDFLGSVAQSGTFPVGRTQEGEEVFVSVRDLIPMVDPFEVELDGWDISSMNLADGLKRAAVFEYELQEKLRPYMEGIIPRKAAFNQDFVAANQLDRADNILEGNKWEQLEQVGSLFYTALRSITRKTCWHCFHLLIAESRYPRFQNSEKSGQNPYYVGWKYRKIC